MCNLLKKITKQLIKRFKKIRFEWVYRVAFVIFTIAAEFIPPSEFLLNRILVDFSAHFVQNFLVSHIILGEFTFWNVWVPFLVSALDIDHFIAASSLSFVKATSLEQQAPFHNLALPIVILCLAGIFLYSNQKTLYDNFLALSLCLFVHLCRDGLRRGVAFCSYRSPPLPFSIYLLVVFTHVFLLEFLYKLSLN